MEKEFRLVGDGSASTKKETLTCTARHAVRTVESATRGSAIPDALGTGTNTAAVDGGIPCTKLILIC